MENSETKLIQLKCPSGQEPEELQREITMIIECWWVKVKTMLAGF